MNSIKVRSGIVYCSGQALLRFASTAAAGIYLMRLGYRCHEEGKTYTFWK